MENRLDNRMAGISPPAWPAILSRISEIDEFKGWWTGRFHPPPAYLGTLRKRAIAASAKSSTGIDWVGLPRRDGAAARPLPSGGADTGRASTACYLHLLKAILDARADDGPLTRDAICRMHGELLRYSPKEQARRGAYRTFPDRSTFPLRRTAESIALRPSEPEQIPERMDALVAWTNQRLGRPPFHPLLVVAGFVLEFLAIRPFASANGRTSRLLTILLLFRCGYAYLPYAPLERVIAERKAEYYLALRKSQASLHYPRPDMGPWFLAFLDAMRAQVRELAAVLGPRPPERRLSANQAGALALLDRAPEITNRLVAQELRLSRETAKQVLSRLVALNLLTRAGAGRAVRYRRAEPA